MSVENIRLIGDGAMQDEDGNDIDEHTLNGPWAEKNEICDGVECAVFLVEGQVALSVLDHVESIKLQDESVVPMLGYERTPTHTKIYIRA